MFNVIAIVAGVILIIMEITMPKPRSYLPALITILALLVVIGIAIEEYLNPDLLTGAVEITVLVGAVVIPLASYGLALWRERLTTILSKLDEDSRQRLENIIKILQQIYFNGKTMVETLSTSIAEDEVAEMKIKLHKTMKLKLYVYLQSHNVKTSFTEKIRVICYAMWDFSIVVLSTFSRCLPYSIREMMFLIVSTVPDTVGIGLSSLEGTGSDLNQGLEAQLWDATRWVRTDNGVNAIRQCLKYAHAVNNVYLIGLLSVPKTGVVILPEKVSRYIALTRGNYDHLMAQKFAEVANVLSKELGE